MRKRSETDTSATKPIIDRESSLRAREALAGEREQAANARDATLAAREEVASLRDQVSSLRDQALNARAEADVARADRELLLAEMREANERLVIATDRAEQLAQEAEVARETVADSEERFRTLVTTSAPIFWRADAQGHIQVDRDSWRTFTGADPETALRDDGWIEAVHSGDRNRVREEWRRATRTTTAYRCEHRLRKHDGSYAHVVSRAVPIVRSGTVREWIGMMTDITDRVKLDEAREQLIAELRDSEERFRLTIDHAPIGMALIALDGQFTRVNRVLCDLVGYNPEELITLTFRDITHPDDLEADVALAAALARGEIPRYQLEKRFLRKDGSCVDAMLSVSILRERNGMPLYSIAQIADITERKRAETAREESERRLALALDAAQMGMWDLDLVTDTSVRSFRHDQIFGYSSPVPTWGAAIFMDRVVPEDQEIARRAFAEALASNIFAMECRIRWPDGSIHWISAKGRAYRNLQGEPIRMLGTIVDISDRKRAEEALQRSENEFRSLAESMPQIVWTTRPDGLNTYFNQQWVDYTGLTLEESYGEGWIIPFHPDDRQRAWDAWQRATRHRDTYSIECRLRRADGVYQWWLIRGAPLLDANGEILKWFGTCTDIEQIKVAEQRLKRIEKEQRFLAEAGSALSTSLDYEETLATVAGLAVRDFADWCMVETFGDSDEFRHCKVVSRDASQADVCAVLEHFMTDRARSPLLRPVVEARESLVIENVTAEHVESLAQAPEHLQALRAARPTSMMAVPLHRQEQLLGVLAFISSTPSRRYDRKDLDLAQGLAERASVAIENARLYKASVQATHIRDQVLGFVAHDLRNPLATIMMQASLSGRSESEPERRSRRPFEVIQRAGNRMNRLIQDILDVQRMVGGQLHVEQARVPVGQIVLDCVEAQRSLASSASLELQLALEQGVADVWADHDRVLQVFENLIGNAVKFTKPGGRITIGAASHDDQVMFWVADTGAGISDEEMPHVFDRFWQAPTARRGGAGLGLQIVKGIVEAHGGRIWVESEVGVGTTFYFTLRTAESARAHPPRAEMH